jgi:UV DNA damage endonuclease
MIRLGLCCINTELRKKNIFCSRTIIRKNFTVEKAQELALKNIADIGKMAKWNYENHIFVFRLSSDIFPHFTDEDTEEYSLEFARESLEEAGELCRKYKQRITMHPGQYNQVGAKEKRVLKNTIKDLTMHADILDMMGMDKNSVLCVHGGGVYGNIDETTQRWIKQFKDLPDNVQKRLAIENCERCYSVIDCLTIAESCNIPLIFDSHHYECYNLIYSKEENKYNKDDKDDKEYKQIDIDISLYMDRIVDTWKKRDIIPLFHVSEQRPDSRIGTHSDFIEKLPSYYLSFPEKYGDLDIEIEAKMKEQAIFKLYEIYPFLLNNKKDKNDKPKKVKKKIFITDDDF